VGLGNGLVFLEVEDAQVRLQAVVLEQQITVEAELAGCRSSSDGMVEHPAERYSIDCACRMNWASLYWRAGYPPRPRSTRAARLYAAS
jgi:hypothetical protein